MDTHIRAMLVQWNSKDKPWTPVAFNSKGPNSAHQKYSTYDREFLSCYLAVKKFCHFLKGWQFQLLTDHKMADPQPPQREEQQL